MASPADLLHGHARVGKDEENKDESGPRELFGGCRRVRRLRADDVDDGDNASGPEDRESGDLSLGGDENPGKGEDVTGSNNDESNDESNDEAYDDDDQACVINAVKRRLCGYRRLGDTSYSRLLRASGRCPPAT